MPGAIQRVGFRFRQSLDAEIDQDLVEDHPMESIEVAPRQLARAHAVHARGVAAAPRIGELRAINSDALAPGQILDLLRHR